MRDSIEFQRFYREDDPEIGPLDVLYICDMDVGGTKETGRRIISTPNAHWLPKMITGTRPIFLRRDGRFGFEDRSLWPQFYAYGFEYIICIPRKPEDPNNPLSILWWNPPESELLRVQGNSVDIDLFELPPHRMQQLQEWRDRLVNESNEYQRIHKRSPFLGLITTSLRHTWIRITIAPMTRREVVQLVSEFQRLCLDVRAWLDYVLVYAPRLQVTDEEVRQLPVCHHLMGAVTEEPMIVMQLVQMRIPVWHVRSSLNLPPKINITYNVPPSLPRDMVLASYPREPFPVVCNQAPGTLMLEATQRIGCVYLHLFKDISTAVTGSPEDEIEAEISKAVREKNSSRFAPYPGSSSSAPEVASSSSGTAATSTASSSSGTPAYSGHLVAPPPPIKTHAGSRASRTSSSKVAKAAGRDKFGDDVRWHLMPRSLQSWSSTLSSVSRPEGIRGRYKLGYAFPDANTIGGSERNRDIYISTWLSRHAACVWREITNGYVSTNRASAQDWRDFLMRTLMDMRPAVAKNSAQRRRQKAEVLFAGVALVRIPTQLTWFHQVYRSDQALPPAIITQVLWDLCEQNFQLEFLALDRILQAVQWNSKDTFLLREELVRSIFFDDNGVAGGSYLIGGIPSEDMGLASGDWNVRRVFVDNLRTVMSTWPLVHGCQLASGEVPPNEGEFRVFEQNVAKFYCQSFYEVFGQAPCVPHSVKAVSAVPF